MVRVKRCSVGRQLQSLSQREFPQVGLSLWLSAVHYGVTLVLALSSRKTPTTAAFHTWDLAPLTMTSLGRLKSSVKTKAFFHRGHFGPHVLWHPLPTFSGF